MFDGVAGITAVTLTANRTAAAAPIPIAASRPERDEQRVAGERAGAPRRRAGRRRGDRAAARIAEDGEPDAHLDAARRGSPRSRARPGRSRSAGRAPARAATATSSSSGARLNRKSCSELEWKRSVEETMITPSSTSASDVEHRLRDQGAEQDRERLAHPADAAGEHHRAGRLAEAGRQRRRHQHPDHRRRGDVAAAQRSPRQRRRARSRYQEPARRNIDGHISAAAISTQAEVGADDARRRPGRRRSAARRCTVRPTPSDARDAERRPGAPTRCAAELRSAGAGSSERQPRGGVARPAVGRGEADRRRAASGGRSARARGRRSLARRRPRPASATRGQA